MKRSISLVILFFSLLSVISFRNYFFKGLVPIQFNLLPSFYSPWKYFSWPGYQSGVPNKPIGTDNPKLFYPYRKFTVDELKSGRVPLWNPYVFSGNIHAATYQAAVYYPLNFLYFILPLADAWGILVILQPILTGLFTFLFLKSQKISDKGSIFGALSFAFSGWMISWWEESIVIVHSILWLPLALYGSVLLWEQNQHTLKGFLLILIALSMSILAGFLQMTLYLGIVFFFWNMYLLYISKNKSLGKLGLLAASMFLTLLVTAVQWLPAFEAYVYSPRKVVAATFLFEEFLVPLRHLVTFLSPDFWGNPGSYNYFFPGIFYHEKVIYLGIVPLMFVLYGIFHGRGREVVFWKITSVVFLSLGFALPTSWVWYVLRVPILSVANPSRIFVLASFGFSVLAAYGLDHWWKHTSRRKLLLSISPMAIGFILLWTFVLSMYVVNYHYMDIMKSCLGASALTPLCKLISTSSVAKWSNPYATISLRNLVLPTIVFIVSVILIVFFPRRKIILYVMLLLIVFSSDLYFSNKFLYFSDRQFEFPLVEPIRKLKELAGVSRVWSYGNAYVEKNMLSYYGLYSTEGYDALFSQRYGELLYIIKNGGVITDQIHRTDVDLKQASEIEPLDNIGERLHIMSLLGVKYILEAKRGENKDKVLTEKRFPKDLFSLTWEDDTWRIWEYRNALARAIFIPEFVIETDRQHIVSRLFASGFDMKKTIVLEEVPALTHEISTSKYSPISGAEVTIRKYQPTTIEIAIRAPINGFLFLSDNYFSGWNATLDNIPTKIFRADYAFRAVEMPAGEHTVRFVYAPRSFTVASLISVFGLFVTIAFVVLGVRKSIFATME